MYARKFTEAINFWDEVFWHRPCMHTAELSVHVIMKICFVDDEGMQFESNRLHLSRQDELVMWAALIRFFIQLFFSRVGTEVLILYAFPL